MPTEIEAMDATKHYHADISHRTQPDREVVANISLSPIRMGVLIGITAGEMVLRFLSRSPKS